MFLATNLDHLFIWDFLVSKNSKYLEYKFNKDTINKNFENRLKQSYYNNFRWDSLLKLLWISKFWFNYNYNIGDKWIKLKYKNLEIIIELIWNKKYYKIFWKVWFLINHLTWYEKLIRIIDIYLERNNKLIYNLIKWI